MKSHQSPVSPEWRKEWRRNGGGLMTVAALAGAGYVSAFQTFIVLNNGRPSHPSWWSWPFWACIGLAALGFYIFLAAHHDKLFMLGRERPVDHSTKYSLGLMQVDMGLRRYRTEPDRLDVRVQMTMLNGNQNSFLRAYLERMDVTVAGLAPEGNTPDLRRYGCDLGVLGACPFTGSGWFDAAGPRRRAGLAWWLNL
jgi:hypothetical protein